MGFCPWGANRRLRGSRLSSFHRVPQIAPLDRRAEQLQDLAMLGPQVHNPPGDSLGGLFYQNVDPFEHLEEAAQRGPRCRFSHLVGDRGVPLLQGCRT